jgi:D-aminoacyl-tRNA deacylase
MRALFVFSKRDPASRNMLNAFYNLNIAADTVSKFSVDSIVVDQELVYVEGHKLPPSDYYVFLSRHVGGKSCFTIHSTGNPTTENRLGGQPRTLGLAAPLLSYAFLKAMTRNPPLPVVYEATHHGPTDTNSPCIFVEIGITEEDWNNPDYSEYILGSLLEALKNYDPPKERVACCFGGPHYASQFTEYAIREKYCIGHIISKHAIAPDDRQVVEMAVERCEPKPTQALVDWKGLKSHQKKTVLEAIKALGLEPIKI